MPFITSIISRLFLSTPPSRVATRAVAHVALCGYISIHATLAGGDLPLSAPFRARCISIHATLAGGDLGITKSAVGNYISIHATLAGGDGLPLRRSPPQADFYPRHPRGWRRWDLNEASASYNISIHATLAGGDSPSLRRLDLRFRYFYPRHPRGWRRRPSCVAIPAAEFLSTPPSRVATYRYKTLIHRHHHFYPRHPRGWRRLAPQQALPALLFLSTPPSRVATNSSGRGRTYD